MEPNAITKQIEDYANSQPLSDDKIKELRAEKSRRSDERSRRLVSRLLPAIVSIPFIIGGAPKAIEAGENAVHSASAQVEHVVADSLNAQQRMDEGLRLSDEQNQKPLQSEQVPVDTSQH